MKKPQAERYKPIVEAGHLLILHPQAPAGGYPMVVPVDHVADDLHWFLGSCAPLMRGETLIVESPVQNDARYSTSAVVVASTSETFALRLSPSWERVQQRAFVRISAHGLQVRVVRLAHDGQNPRPLVSLEQGAVDFQSSDPDRDAIHELLDLSAGGIRFQSSAEYEPDEEVVVHFELPGSQCFVLPARVVRTPGGPSSHSGKRNVAVAFTGIDERTRSQLLGWVYRQQIRRHREESR